MGGKTSVDSPLSSLNKYFYLSLSNILQKKLHLENTQRQIPLVSYLTKILEMYQILSKSVITS